MIVTVFVTVVVELWDMHKVLQDARFLDSNNLTTTFAQLSSLTVMFSRLQPILIHTQATVIVNSVPLQFSYD